MPYGFNAIGADRFRNFIGNAVRNRGYDPTAGKDPIKNLESYGERELGQMQNSFASTVLEDVRATADRRDMERMATDARNRADRGADVDEAVFARRTEGMALSDRQKAGAKQRLSLNREIAKASASTGSRRASTARAQQADRALGIGMEDIAFGQQIAGLTGLANAEGQRQVAEANRRASKKAKKNNLIGTAIGIVGAIFSAEEYKDKTEAQPLLLDKLKNVRVDKWKYKGSKAEHIGPYAEEFNKTFGVGTHKDAIDVVSMLGVTLGAIKELNEKVERSGV